METSIRIHGVKKLQKALDQASKAEDKALQTAVKVEGFKLRKKLQKEIRQGDPGGRQFNPLSFIRRKTGRTTKPLRRLAIAVRYFIPSTKPFEMHIGWTGRGVSKKWKYLAKAHQEGFTTPVTEKQRRYFRQLAGEMTKRSKVRRYLLLKRTTTRFVTPARPILEPFWQAYRERTWRNIKRNYRRKLAGERI